MRKLLIILLLFFPIHGAWAEKLILVCSYFLETTTGNPHSMSFLVDLKKKTVRNSYGRYYEFPVITTDLIKFKAMSEEINRHNKSSIEEIEFNHFYINRNTGNFLIRTKYLMRKKYKDTAGTCEETTKKF